MTLRIAYLSGQYPRATDTFIQREVAALRATGINVETISVRRPPASEQGSQEQQEERRQTRYLLPCNPFRLLMDHLSVLLKSPARYCQSFWLALTVRGPGLKAIILQLFYFAEAGMVAAQVRRCSLVHLHNHAPDASGYVTMIAACMGNFTYSMTLHGFGILSEPRRWRLKEKLERCAFAICVSWYARSQAMLWTDPRYWHRFHVVHCGIESDAAIARTHQGQGNRLLFVGRLDPVKGLPVLFNAIQQLKQDRPDIHLDIVGDGPERSSLSSLARNMKLQDTLTWHGYLTQRELRPLLRRADVMVMSSFAEGIPVSLMEAMSHGVPVVAPRIAGIPELVIDGVNSKLTTPARSDEIAHCVGELLDDPELRTRLGQAAAELVCREFNVEVEVQKLVRVMSRYLHRQEQPLPADLEAIVSHANVDAHANASVGALK